jgi:LEA14-like dessication related protein
MPTAQPLRALFMIRIIKTTLVFIVIFSLQACSWMRQEFKDPDIQVVGFSYLPGDNILEQHFALRLQLTNPNDLELEVKGIGFEFAVAGVELMHGASNGIPLIKPYSSTEFTVQGSANVIQAMRLLKKMHKNPQNRFDYTLNTKIDLAHGWPSTFNLKREGNIGLDDWLGKQ